MQEVPSWLTNVSDLGIVVFLLITIYGGLREKPLWYPGSVVRRDETMAKDRFDAMQTDRDYYRGIALRSLSASEKAAENTKVAIEHRPPTDPPIASDQELLQGIEEARKRGLIQ